MSREEIAMTPWARGEAAEPIYWEAVYRAEMPRIYNFFRYRLGDRDLAEDLTALTFEKAWRHRRRYRHDLAKYSTWLYSIARNVATDHLRKHQPAVRAVTQRVIRTIGGLPFDVTDEYPGREGPIETLESEQLSFAQARAELPFTLRLPTWTPDGYRLEDTVTITHLPDGSLLAMVTWRGNQNRLFLDVFSSAETLNREGGIAVGPGSVEEVLLRGRPAALVRGAWDANARAWGPGSLIGLHWTEGGQGYRLGGMAEHVTAAELMGMAASMP